MPTDIGSARTSRWRLAWLYFAAVMVTNCIIILTARLPPTHVDYPMWAYEGILFHNVITGHPDAGYVIKHYPVPQCMTIVCVGLLNLVFSWNIAAKLWLCIYLVLGSFGSWLMANALRITNALVIVALPPILFLNLDFWWGHISFEVGMCFVMILVALMLRQASSWLLALVLLCTFFAHMEACACGCLFLGLWILFNRQWSRIWVAVPVLALSFWYAAGRIASGNADAGTVPDAVNRYGSKGFLIFKSSSYLKIFGYVNARTAEGLSQSEAIFGRPLFLVLLALSLIVGVLCVYSLARASFVHKNSAYRYLRAGVLFLLVFAAFVPQIFLGSSDPGSRLVLMAAAIGFFLMDWNKPAAKVIAALSIAFTLANTWQFARIDNNPTMAGHPIDLPLPLVTYGQTYPTFGVVYWQALESGHRDLAISTTALFLQTKK